jgi:acyl transferase domain-containing protein
MEPLAIVGCSFKGPQEAIDEENLWKVLESQRNLMTEWPADRCTLDAFHDGESGKTFTVNTTNLT